MSNQDEKIVLKPSGFDVPNLDAEVIIVGITPGPTQINEGRVESSLENKRLYAFKGMRKNIEMMLDYIGVNKLLGIESCHTIWDVDFNRIDLTSLIKDAAFEKNKDSNEKLFNDPKKIWGSPKLLEEFKKFVTDCDNYKNAKLFVACGHRVYDVLIELKEEGHIEAPVVAIAHPGKNNMPRIKYYWGEEESSFATVKEDSQNAKFLIDSLL